MTSFQIDENYANSLRKKETQYKTETGTKKGINTIMLTTWGIEGKHALGLVTKNLTMECLFEG